MTSPLMQQKALEALVLINTAVTNLRLYPPTSAMIANAVGKLYQALLDIFETTDSINVAETEKNMLVNGDPLGSKDLEKPPVRAFLELLLAFGLRSISLKKGIEKQELLDFLQLISKRPETIENEGGLQKLMAGIQAPHIILDEKIYIAKDADQQILAALEIKDDEIIQYMVGNIPDLVLDYQKLKELARQPEWIAEIFHRGMMQIRQQREFLSNIKVSENLIRMLGILEKVMGDLDQDKIAQLIGKTIAELDAEMITLFLSQNIDGLLGGRLFEIIVNYLDDAKFGDVVKKIKGLDKSPAAKSLDQISGGKDALDKTRERLLASDRGVQYQQEMEKRKALQKEKLDRQVQAIKEKMMPETEGAAQASPDNRLADYLMEAADELAADGEYEYLDAVIQHAAEGLLSRNQAQRDSAAAVLSQILERLPEQEQFAALNRIADTLTRWLKIETSATLAYRTLCDLLRNQIGRHISEKRFAEFLPVLEVFHLIAAGILEKNDTIHAIVSDIIRDLASPERLDFLLDAFSRGEETARVSAGKVLVRLGDTPLNLVLDLLRDQQDAEERVRILHLMIEVGQPTIPIIRQRLNHDEPWYFLRNLVYILGRIDNQASAELIGDFLLHKNDKVRQEALKSIQRVGGSRRGPVLASLLPMVDESFQKNIVDELGTLRYAAAVPALMELFETKSLVPSASRTDLEERICLALGRIGAQDAVPLLTQVSKPKGFFSLKSYPDKVRNAAARALFQIKTSAPT